MRCASNGHESSDSTSAAASASCHRDEYVPALDAYAGMVKSITGNLGCM